MYGYPHPAGGLYVRHYSPVLTPVRVLVSIAYLMHKTVSDALINRLGKLKNDLHESDSEYRLNNLSRKESFVRMET